MCVCVFVVCVWCVCVCARRRVYEVLPGSWLVHYAFSSDFSLIRQWARADIHAGSTKTTPSVPYPWLGEECVCVYNNCVCTCMCVQWNLQIMNALEAGLLYREVVPISQVVSYPQLRTCKLLLSCCKKLLHADKNQQKSSVLSRYC